MNETVLDVRRSVLEATQAANQAINNHMNGLAQKTNEQIAKLDAALENELQKSISSLATQLTSLSRRFVDDDTPLTQRLQEVLALARTTQPKPARILKRTPEDHWIPLSDLMTGLMMIFMLVAIIFMLQLKAKEKEVKDIGKNYTDLRSELCSELKAKFKDDERDLEVDPSCSLSITFLNSDNQFDLGKSDVKPSFKDKLAVFFPKYVAILNSKKYRDFV